MKKDYNCSLLVNSCDKFKDAWHPYFSLLRKYWPNCPYNLYINTESLICPEDGVVTLNSLSNSWTDRLIESLNRIETDFVILSLEDFFLMGRVKEEKIIEILKIMHEDTSIAVVYPKQISNYRTRDSIRREWVRMDLDIHNKYLINFQFAIWNRKALLSLLEPGKSPWQIEREYVLSPNNRLKFYCIPIGSKTSCKDDIFPYLFAIENGYGIAQSKWLWNNKKFFKKEGLSVNFESLGVLSYCRYLMKKLVFKLKLIFKLK